MSKRTMALMAECAPVFNMLQDENRQLILALLFDNGPMTVGDLAEGLPISRPAVSHHLKLLRDAGLLAVERSGKERIYRLQMEGAYAKIEELAASLRHDIEEKRSGT